MWPCGQTFFFGADFFCLFSVSINDVTQWEIGSPFSFFFCLLLFKAGFQFCGQTGFWGLSFFAIFCFNSSFNNMEMWPRVDDKLQLSQMWVSAGRGDRIRPTHKCMKRRTLHMKWGEGRLCSSSSFLSGASSLFLIGGERDQPWRCSLFWSFPWREKTRYQSHRILCAK